MTRVILAAMAVIALAVVAFSPAATSALWPDGRPIVGTNGVYAKGDVDCSGAVDSVDALKVLRHVAALSVSQKEGCEKIGGGAFTSAGAGGAAGVTNGDSAGFDAMSIDMKTAGNGATVLGALDFCARINENDIQDADETAVDTLAIDVTALNIPASRPVISWGYDFGFPGASVLVATEDQNFLLASLPGSALFAGLSDPLPDSVSPWISTAVDGVPASAETGSGVLSRLTIETFPGSVSGLFPLTLSSVGLVDTAAADLTPEVTNNAQVAVNEPCGAGPTPTPKQGDMNCDGAVTSVDALLILRHVAALAVSLPDGCASIGSG